MGFNYYNYGNVRDCRITQHKLLVRDPFGRVQEYSLLLDVETDWQCNVFMNPYIAFLIYTNDGREIIGRFDGSITLYRDNLMVGLSCWQPKKNLLMQHVGYFSGVSSLQRIMLDTTDHQTLFVDSLRYETLLPQKLFIEPNITTALAIIEQGLQEAIILTKGGKEVEIPVWSIQDTLRIGTCRSIV